MQRFVEQRQSLYAVAGLALDVFKDLPQWSRGHLTETQSTVLVDWIAVSETAE